jgi:hypothetical protein
VLSDFCGSILLSAMSKITCITAGRALGWDTLYHVLHQALFHLAILPDGQRVYRSILSTNSAAFAYRDDLVISHCFLNVDHKAQLQRDCMRMDKRWLLLRTVRTCNLFSVGNR